MLHQVNRVRARWHCLNASILRRRVAWWSLALFVLAWCLVGAHSSAEAIAGCALLLSGHAQPVARAAWLAG